MPPKDYYNQARTAQIRNYLNAIRRESPIDNMPGTQMSLEHKLVPILAEEALSLHEEIAALKKQLEDLKKK